MPPPALRLDPEPLVDAAAAALGVLVSRSEDGPSVDPDASPLIAGAFGIDLVDELSRAKAKGEPGEVVEVALRTAERPAEAALLAGTGDGSLTAMRRAGAALARRCRGRGSLAVAVPAGTSAEALRALAEGLVLAAYAQPRAGVERPESKRPVGAVSLHVLNGAAAEGTYDEAVRRAVVTGQAGHLARDLANTPSDIKDPAWLAGEAVRLGAVSGVEVSVRDERALAAGGFGGILAVGRGSARPPRLISLTYRPAGRGLPHVVLVGKGITFDSGGLSLKPRDAMLPMKTDMTGGGVVISVLAALRDLRVPVRVTGLVAAAENLPGADAVRPGDVLTSYGGRTVEVFNTDAEGRLVLADALAYADAELDPDVVVDIATLTGAASQGLGRRHAALYTGDDALAAELGAAGEASGERVWRMPLVDDYRFVLDSDIADLSHIARDRTISGGSITAALFLREFVGARRWAHLDIAGPARADSDEHEVSKGGTGYGARLLLRWLEGFG